MSLGQGSVTLGVVMLHRLVPVAVLSGLLAASRCPNLSAQSVKALWRCPSVHRKRRSRVKFQGGA